MSSGKRQRNDAGSLATSWVTEPESLEVHPFSALLDAVASDDFAEVSRLLDLDRDSARDCTPKGLPTMTPPLIHAVWRGNDQIAELLLQRTASDALAGVSDVGFGGNPIHWAAAAGRSSMLEGFISRAGPSCIDLPSFEGYTALHAAAGHGHTRCVQILLRNKANPNALDREGSGPLHEAAAWGHTDAARELLTSRADARLATRTGDTPLLLAARGGHAPLVELLLDAGAPIDPRNSAGITPLLFAAFHGHGPTVQVLRARGADEQAVDLSKSRTPLQWAAYNDHRAVVEAMLGPSAATADLVALAREGGAEEVVAFLGLL